MATIMIGYDLNRPKQNYVALYEAIKSLANWWWHNLDSTWLIVTNRTPAQVRDTLAQHLDADDELLVIDVTGRARAWRGFKGTASTWLNETYT